MKKTMKCDCHRCPPRSIPEIFLDYAHEAVNQDSETAFTVFSLATAVHHALGLYDAARFYSACKHIVFEEMLTKSMADEICETENARILGIFLRSLQAGTGHWYHHQDLADITEWLKPIPNADWLAQQLTS